MNLIKTKCPVCNYEISTDKYLLFNPEDAARHLLDQKLDNDRFAQFEFLVSNIWGNNDCAYIDCPECRLGFAYPFIAGDKDLYSFIYNNINSYPKWKWEYQITFEEIKKRIDNSKSTLNLLEIGAGDGAFLRKISPELISRENIICTEYSNAGKREIEKYGINCYSLDVRDPFFVKYSGYFDLVCVFQVLEHLDDLEGFFRRIDLITKSNSDIFIAVPNDQMTKFYNSMNCFLDIPPIHISSWNKDSLSFIAKRFGWVIKDHKIESQSYLSKAIRFIRIMFPKTKTFHLVKAIRISALRKSLLILSASVYALFHVPEIYALRSAKLGLNQWVHIQKN